MIYCLYLLILSASLLISYSYIYAHELFYARLLRENGYEFRNGVMYYKGRYYKLVLNEIVELRSSQLFSLSRFTLLFRMALPL